VKDAGDVSDLRKRQLPLGFPIQQRCTLDSFEAGPNVEVVAALGAAGGGRFRVLWVVGERGSGKSHLLQGACHAAVARGAGAVYLPSRLRDAGPRVFDGLESFEVVAIDDLQDWLAAVGWEEALLAFYQRLFDRRATLLLAAAVAPFELNIGLADLASRLRSAEVYRLAPLDDADRTRAMQRWAAGRGLSFGADVLPFLLRRLPRGMDALWAAFERLDGASLAQQRRLTIPLVKEILQL
jgi:DnaA-homolog protein